MLLGATGLVAGGGGCGRSVVAGRCLYVIKGEILVVVLVGEGVVCVGLWLAGGASPGIDGRDLRGV
jgi:hypothetical protein